jgi:16S rRNA (cytidine1402-2'-O)-methyltransferase
MPLFIISTPIGHLGDISQRALDTLRACDLILCEDTRHSQILLRHYGIDKRLIPFHQFNEKSKEESILRDLEQGQSIALISDAGTPLVSDPGQALVRACIERGVPFTAIPGPCSIIQALVLSGFDAIRFQFIGFLPRDAGAIRTALRRALFFQGTTIAFESPQRLLDTLTILLEIDPNRELAIARELTKTFEECRRGKAADLLAHFQEHEPRGEIVLLIREGETVQEEIGVEELVRLLQEMHALSLKEAIKAAAKLKGVPKSDVYRQIHQPDNPEPL